MFVAATGVPLPTALARVGRGAEWEATADLAKGVPASTIAYGCQPRCRLEPGGEEPAVPAPPEPLQELEEREAPAPPSAAQVIQGVLDDTGMSVTGLSHVFGVSRQAVYKWLDGGKLQSKHEEKLDELAEVVNMLKGAGVSLRARTLRRQIAGWPPILEELKKADGDALGVAREVLPYLKAEAEQRRRRLERSGGKRVRPGKFTRFGIPHLRED